MVYLTSLEDKLCRLQVVREATRENLNQAALLQEQTEERRNELKELWLTRMLHSKLAIINAEISQNNLEVARAKDKTCLLKREHAALLLHLEHSESVLHTNIDKDKRIAEIISTEHAQLLNMTRPGMHESEILEREARSMKREDLLSARLHLDELKASEPRSSKKTRSILSLRQLLQQTQDALAEESAFLSQLHRLYPAHSEAP